GAGAEGAVRELFEAAASYGMGTAAASAFGAGVGGPVSGALQGVQGRRKPVQPNRLVLVAGRLEDDGGEPGPDGGGPPVGGDAGVDRSDPAKDCRCIRRGWGGNR